MVYKAEFVSQFLYSIFIGYSVSKIQPITMPFAKSNSNQKPGNFADKIKQKTKLSTVDIKMLRTGLRLSTKEFPAQGIHLRICVYCPLFL